MKTTLEGELVWVTEGPLAWPGLPWLPTDATVVPGTDRLLVADGYGSSYVHQVLAGAAPRIRSDSRALPSTPMSCAPQTRLIRG